MNTAKREMWVLSCFLVLVIAVFSGLMWRIFDLKHNHKQSYEDISRVQRSAVVPETPRRGMVVDAKGRYLAASIKTYNVFIDSYDLKDYPDQVLVTASSLQDILQIPGHVTCEKIESSKSPRYVKIKSDISDEERVRLKEASLRGVGIESDWKRTYPAGELTSHLLGFVGADNTGLAGLELQYNSVLEGTSGSQVYVVDALRRPIASKAHETKDTQNGLNLVLTIDSVIQRFVHEALSKKVTEYEAESGVAVVMDPWTGGILAMVSLPDFDPAAFGKTPQDRMRNRVLTDPFEPGSIFKPLVATIGLESQKVGFNEKFYCEDGFWSKYGGIGEFGNHKYGSMSVRNIIIHSSNVGMAKMGLKMGQKNLYEGLTMLGFSSRTGVDLPGEEPGLVWPLRKWSRWSVTRIPFGHEVLVTPLQICRAYSILANGGYVVKPHVVRAIVDHEGDIIENKQPARGTGFILDKEVSQWMVTKALADVVNEGTGDKAKLENCQVWGKTGTANIAINGRYDWRNYVSSFVGGAPADKPAVVVLVSIRKPKRSLGKGYSGGRVAAPVVHDILENTLTYMGILKPEPLAETLMAAQ